MENLAQVFKQSDEGHKILTSKNKKDSRYTYIKGLKTNIEPGKYKRPKESDQPKLQETFRLCFLNEFNRIWATLHHNHEDAVRHQKAKESYQEFLKEVPIIYGELFYKHHELKQKIRNSLESDLTTFKEIKPNLEQILKDEFELFLNERSPVPPKDLSEDSLIKCILTAQSEENSEVDEEIDKVIKVYEMDLKKDRIFPKYTASFRKLIKYELDLDNDVVILNNLRPDRHKFQKLWLPNIQLAYFSILLINVIEEIEETEEKYVRYKPYFRVEKPSDAVEDFFDRNGLPSYSDHTDSQIAHLIELRYRTFTDGKLKFDSLRKAVQRFR